MPTKNIFTDIHCHSTIGAYNTNPKKFWDYDPPKDRQRDNFLTTFFLSPYSQSQCSILAKGNVRVAIASLYPIEQGFFGKFLDNALDKKYDPGNIPNTIIRDLIDDSALSAIKPVGAKIIFNLPLSRYVQIKSDNHDYFNDVRSEYNYLSTQLNESANIGGKTFRIKIVRNFNELQSILSIDEQLNYNSASDNIIALILTVEGGHALGCGQKNTSHITPEKLNAVDADGNLTDADTIALFKKISGNINDMKQWGTNRNGDHCPFFITLAHHFWNQLCGHSMSFAGFMNNLFDQKEGMNTDITELGKAVVKELLQKHPSTGKRILIDVKHMSPKARYWYYYDYIKKHNEANPNDKIPIIASHTAVNNRTYLLNRESYDPPDMSNHEAMDNLYDTSGTFNNWQINLSDEEIKIIYESGGIIGLILDQRILAGKGLVKNITIIAEKHPIGEYKLLYQSIWAEPIVQNILYIVKLIGDKGWEMMTLGSDFDGMINPLDAFCYSEDFESLRTILIQKLEMRALVEPVLKGKNISELVDSIMYKNTLKFLKKHFK